MGTVIGILQNYILATFFIVPSAETELSNHVDLEADEVIVGIPAYVWVLSLSYQLGLI